MPMPGIPSLFVLADQSQYFISTHVNMSDVNHPYNRFQRGTAGRYFRDTFPGSFAYQDTHDLTENIDEYMHDVQHSFLNSTFVNWRDYEAEDNYYDYYRYEEDEIIFNEDSFNQLHTYRSPLSSTRDDETPISPTHSLTRPIEHIRAAENDYVDDLVHDLHSRLLTSHSFDRCAYYDYLYQRNMHPLYFDIMQFQGPWGNIDQYLIMNERTCNKSAPRVADIPHPISYEPCSPAVVNHDEQMPGPTHFRYPTSTTQDGTENELIYSPSIYAEDQEFPDPGTVHRPTNHRNNSC